MCIRIRSRCSSAKRMRWGFAMPPSGRSYDRHTTPIAKPRMCLPRLLSRTRLGGSVASAAAIVAFAGLFFPFAARAEVSTVRISYGYGILYLPLMVMDREQLLEKRARTAGLADIKVDWKTFDGGNVINDAMLAGALDIA